MTAQNSTAVEAEDQTKRGWQGEVRDRSAPARRQWEGGAGSAIDRHFRGAHIRWRLRVMLFLLLAVSLTVGFLALLLHVPQRTPLVVVAATDYAWPLPPNGWSREDGEGLARLDGETVQLVDTTLGRGWKSRQHILAEWERTLKKVAARPSNTNSAIFYLSLHGVVAEDGKPYLIPPGASPLDPQEWVAVEELLAPMERWLRPELGKLLILDCNRQLTNWNAGILHNTFAQRLDQLLVERLVPNLLVLNSTAPDQVAWASPDLRASVFGRMVLRGLAGAADTTDSRAGNGNGIVTARELHRYVSDRVNDWAVQQRGTRQTPRLMPDGVADFPVAWAMRPGAVKRLEQTLPKVSGSAESVTHERLNALWAHLDTIRSINPAGASPVDWHELEHQLLWLEQLASAGVAYADRAERIERELLERLSKAAARVATAKDRPGLASRVAVLDPNGPDWPRTLPIRSATLRDHLGVPPPSAAKQTAGTGKGPPMATSIARDAAAGEATAEAHFEQLARAYHIDQIWSDGSIFRDLLSARQRLEELAARQDERAHRWLKTWLDDADQRRRVAEDQWFAGEAHAKNNPAAQVDAIHKELVGAPQSPYGGVTQAWATRDRAWAEIPYLARWLAGPAGTTVALAGSESTASPAATPVSATLDPVNVRLPKLLAAAHGLNQRLENAPASPAASLPSLLSEAAEVQRQLDAWRGELDVICARLDEPTDVNPSNYRLLEELLSLPNLTVAHRGKLRTMAATMSTELHQSWLQRVDAAAQTPLGQPRGATSKPMAETAPPPGTETASQWERLVFWETHPLIAILFWPDEQTAPDAKSRVLVGIEPHEAWRRVERWGQRVRRHLRLVATASPTMVGVPEETDGDQRLSAAERDVRVAAPIGLEATSRDLIQARRRRDLQRVLVWYARRNLDDCYGAGPRPPHAVAASTVFFDRATRDYVLAAELMTTPDAATTEQLERLGRDRVARVEALARFVALAITTDAGTAGAEQVGYQIAIARPASSGTQSAAQADGSPTGMATVFLRDGRQMPVGQRAVVAIPLPDGARTTSVAAPAAQLAGGAPEVVFCFRGNEIVEPVPEEQSAGLLVDVRPDRSRDAQITLVGDRLQQSSIVFILDCSGSMSTLIPVEAAGPSSLPRLELAKSALAELLDQLAPRGDTRVGVRFFGHRVGWTKEKPVQVARQPAYPDAIPDDLLPSDDVELFLPLGRFDSVEAGRVLARLRALQPWGQSPLYRALIQARADFDAERPETNKSVVVITDGENYQFTGADAAVRTAGPTARDVIAAFQGRDIPIYILGFGIQSAPEEFVQLADGTNGEYLSVQNGGDLLKSLRAKLSKGAYTVNDDQGRPLPAKERGATTTRLNLPVSATGLGNGSREYTIRFESIAAKVALEGGENLTFQVGSDGKNLFAAPYDPELPVADTLAAPSRHQRYTARVHRPIRGRGEVRFPISIQDESLAFTPRPAEAWIEITPVTASGDADGPTYLFYDRDFQRDKPVPVLNCRAVQWPADARRAEVRLWFKSFATPPAQAIPLSDVAKDAARFAEGQAVEGVDGVLSRIVINEIKGAELPWEVRVVTQHSQTGLDVAALKVQIDAPPALRAQHIRHRYDHARREVTHSFWFDQQTAQRLLADGGGRITFTSRSATREGAWRTPNDRPITVEIAGNQETLPLDAASGPR